MKNTIQKVIHTLNSGGVILYPTDTVWGLGCDATNANAVKKLFSLKNRIEDKSVIVLIDHIERLKNYVNPITGQAQNLLTNQSYPQTVIFPKAQNLPNGVINQNNSLACRIPKHEFCSTLLKEFQKPLVSTSANISGEKTPLFFHEISEKIKKNVDFIVPTIYEGKSTHSPSQITLFTEKGETFILRK